MLKNVNVATCGVPVTSLFTRDFVDRPHESQKLTWNDPVEIPIFNLLIMFVFFDIKGMVIIPALLNSKIESLNAVLDGALVVTFTFACVAIGSQKAVVGL